MTFDELRDLLRGWPEVEEGQSYGTPALKVRGKLLVRLLPDGDSIVVPDVEPDERAMLVEAAPDRFYFTDHYRDWPMMLVRLGHSQVGDFEHLLQRRHRGLLAGPAKRKR